MPSGISAGVSAAFQAFAFYGLIWFAYSAAKLIAPESTTFKMIWKGFLACAFFAAFAAAMLGQPSCDDSGESLNGSCESYADDGYTSTSEQRTKSFIKLFLLTFLPLLIAASKESERRRELALIEKYALMKKVNDDRSRMSGAKRQSQDQDAT